MNGLDPSREVFALLDEALGNYADHLIGCPALSGEPVCDCGYHALQARANALREHLTGAGCQHHTTRWHVDPDAISRIGTETCRVCAATREVAGDHDGPWHSPAT